MQAHLAVFEIDLLTGPGDHAYLQIDDAVLAEARYRLTGLGIQRHQTIAGGDEHDAVVALAVAPIRNAAAGKLARSNGGPLAFAHAISPQLFAGGGIQRNYGAASAAGGINDTLHHQRRAFQFVFRARSQIIGLKAPGHFQFGKIRRVNLVQRRILGALQIRRIVRPLPVLRGGKLGPQSTARQNSDHENFAHVSPAFLCWFFICPPVLPILLRVQWTSSIESRARRRQTNHSTAIAEHNRRVH